MAVPNITALPLGAGSTGNWVTFPGSSWAINTPYTDTTGTVLRRCTNASTPGTNSGANFEYSSAGPKISRPWGPGLDKYHVAYLHNAGSSGDNIQVFDVQRGLGAIIGSNKSITIPAFNLGHCFSNVPGEEHIIYFSNKGSPSTVHRYDCNADAYASNAIFSGTNASVASGGNLAGYFSMNWGGTGMCWMTPFVSPTALHYFNLVSGVRTTYSGSLTNVNEIKLCKGSTRLVYILNNDGTKRWWFVDTNRTTSDTTFSSLAGHSEFGETRSYIPDQETTPTPLHLVNPGTAPASDGGAWNGSETLICSATSPDTNVMGDMAPNMSWDQTGAGTSEWYVMGSDVNGPGLMHRCVANGWSVHSGSIYKTTVTYNVGFGAETRGVNGIIILDGSANFISSLTKVGSLGAVVEGTFFWDSGTNTVYAWKIGGGTLASVSRMVSHGKNDEAVCYYRQDSSSVRKLAHLYTNSTAYTYEKIHFFNQSPDGKIVMWGSTLGINAGRVDLIMAEVPLTTDTTWFPLFS